MARIARGPRARGVVTVCTLPPAPEEAASEPMVRVSFRAFPGVAVVETEPVRLGRPSASALRLEPPPC
ncbi:MAG: hypothetical protein QOK40_3355 [Miltoncostaeaceae bacterium]|nr:hypothetical protein [Miltoncostaeaceae bacterium]